MAARQRLEKYLHEEGVTFEVLTHSVAYTAQEVAAIQHTPGRQLAKVVLVDADGALVMLVLPAHCRVHFPKAKDVLEASKVRLAREEEFGGTFTDCEVGAMPPFGNLYGLPVYVDSSLADAREIVFKVGSHSTSFRMGFSDYERLVEPKVVEFGDCP
jgi:Ala-tRNA(Pro) deacylase